MDTNVDMRRNGPSALDSRESELFSENVLNHIRLGERPFRLGFGMTITATAEMPKTKEEVVHLLNEMDQWIKDSRQYLDELVEGIGIFGPHDQMSHSMFFGLTTPGTDTNET